MLKNNLDLILIFYTMNKDNLKLVINIIFVFAKQMKFIKLTI